MLINNVLKKKIDIKIKANNIFCTYSQIEKNIILHNGSAGKYKIRLSKIKINHKIKSNCIFNTYKYMNIRIYFLLYSLYF